ncbi:MAG TPA: GNAT family N-acetyltransferase [Clostridia bacterium]|nr:GNAT family N-acetyltransferase [Clostridia bacterium]
MIRKLKATDKSEYLDMVAAFYSSDAVSHKVEPWHFAETFEELMRSDTYTECYILERDNDIGGYVLLLKTFSQEAGGLTVWVEELYVKPNFRSAGLGTEFFRFLDKNIFPNVKRLRLEVEKENKRAISLYKRYGFKTLDYMQMIKGRDEGGGANAI